MAAATVAAYWRTFSVPLVFDDIDAIADNPTIRHWGTALWAPIATTAGGRPILNLTLAANYAAGGTGVWGYHAVNLAIHVLAGLVLFGIVRRSLAPRAGAVAAPMALCAALLWSVHPLQTESVTYIVQRAESLMGLFYLLTLYCFIRGAEAGTAAPADRKAARRRDAWFGLAFVACLLGMGTKEVMVSAPLVVFLYDRTFLAGSFGEAWRLRGKVHGWLASTWVVLAALVYLTHGRNGAVGFGSGVSWWGYAQTQFPAIVRYLRLSFWPHGLVFDYGTQWVTDFWAVLPSALVVAGLAGASAWALFRPGILWRFLGFSGVWFFAILAPTSLVPGNRQTAAEHRMYLALIPVIVPVVLGIYRWLGRAALPVCAALAAGLFLGTWERNGTYLSALNLWAETVANCPGNAFARSNLGCELEAVPGRSREAMAQYKEALRLSPGFAEAHNNLGHALNGEGRTGEAIAELEEALRLKPDYAEAHNNLGIALEKVPGRLPDATDQYREAVRLKPEDAEAHNNLGNALNAAGRTGEAIAELEEALRLRPDYAEAHNNLGNALARTPGRMAGALAEFKEALRLKPDYAEALYNLGNALNADGRPEEAIVRYEEALRIRPGYAEARNNLANTLNGEGRTEEAIVQYREALRLVPEAAAVHFNLAVALLKTAGRTDEAAAHLEEALRLQPDNDAARRILAGIRALPP